MSELSAEQQLQQLEREYQERRAQIEQQQAAPEQMSESTHESMSHVTEEAIQEARPEFQASSHAPRTVSQDTLAPEDMQKLESWIQIAETKGPYAAINEVKDADPALLDAFHAALTGALHDRLISAKKLEEVQ